MRAFCPALPSNLLLLPWTARESCQSSEFSFVISTVVTEISTSRCGTSSSAMSRSYIAMRVAESRTITAFRRLSARMTGVNPAPNASRTRADASSTSFVDASRTPGWFDEAMISWRMCAMPLICAVLSGPDTRSVTLSAHVFRRGKMRVTISFTVRIRMSRSALSIVRRISCT